MRRRALPTDEELRQGSNRTHYRLLAGLSPEVARRYGYDVGSEPSELQIQQQIAVNAQDWKTAGDIAQQLAARQEG
jgi:hypothetical protein